MRSYLHLLLSALLLLGVTVVVSPSANAQNAGTLTISGVVTDQEGNPVEQATVTYGKGRGTVTDAEGRYTLRLSAGTYELEFAYLGYDTQTRKVELQRNRRVDVTLKESSINIGNVEVYGKSQAQQVKESAFAVNALNIKPMINSISNLNDLVNRTTGIKVREEGGVGSEFDLSINGMSGNSVRYFLDGMPLDTKGSDVTLSNLPLNMIERVEIYKGVVPASLGADALGGAINIITKQDKKNYLDASYSYGSFETHKVDVNAQIVEPHTGLMIKPVFGLNSSKNNYKMKEIEVWNEDTRKYEQTTRRRFHDDYFSLLGQIEVGFANKSWADAAFISASYSKVDKELQTGSIQDKVYGDAERSSNAWNISARYSKRNFIIHDLNVSASLSQTWDHSITTDTAYRKYDWNGDYIYSSRNEITGKGRSIRHYKRPMTVGRANLDYHFNSQHSLNLNYMISRTGNNRYDDVDNDFTPSNDALTKHIIGLSYNQSLFGGKMNNVFFVKDYINHTHVEQTDNASVTGSADVMGSNTHSYWGGGVGMRFTIVEPFSVKASFERSVRLPMARELLGNGTTIYPNLALDPENSINVNAGIFGTWHPARGHTVYYETGGFIRNVDDYIQAQVSEQEGMMQYVNLPAVHIKGLEAELRYSYRNTFNLSLNGSLQESRDQRKYMSNGKPSATYNNRVPNKPWMFANAEADYVINNVGLPQSKLRLEASYQWVHWYFLTWEAYGSKGTKARIPNQHSIDATVTLSWKNERYNLSFDCRNLFDSLLYDNYRLQKPGRAMTCKFRVFID